METDSTAMFSAELEPEERILWSGQPQQGLVLHAWDMFLIPFSLMWGGFALFWESAVILGGAPRFFALWGIPFVVIGLYFIVGRFFVDARRREKTYYALTSQRIIIFSGLFSRNTRTVNLKTVSDITTDIKGNDRGTITFGPNVPFASWYSSFAWSGTRGYSAPAFEGIENARQVYELIRKVQREM